MTIVVQCWRAKRKLYLFCVGLCVDLLATILAEGPSCTFVFACDAVAKTGSHCGPLCRLFQQQHFLLVPGLSRYTPSPLTLIIVWNRSLRRLPQGTCSSRTRYLVPASPPLCTLQADNPPKPSLKESSLENEAFFGFRAFHEPLGSWFGVLVGAARFEPFTGNLPRARGVGFVASDLRGWGAG